MKAVKNDLHALNEVTSVISGSLDPEVILNKSLEKTLSIFSAGCGGIYLFNQARQILTLAACQGFPHPLPPLLDHQDLKDGIFGQVILNSAPLIIHDFSRENNLPPAIISDSRQQTFAGAPLKAKGKVLGLLFLLADHSREFSGSELQLLSSIGSQIGMGVENACLFAAEQRRSEQFRVISEVGRQITSIMDIDQILEQVVRLVQETFQYDHVAIATIEGDYAIYRVGAGHLWEDPDFDFRPARLKIGREGVTGWVAAAGEAVYLPDVKESAIYVEMKGSNSRSELTVPVKVKGRVIGVLDAQSEQLDAFDDSDMIVMQSLADQTAVALENARLYEQAQHLAIIEERNRLARELHDSVTQALYGITLHAEAAIRQLGSGDIHLTGDQLQELRDTAQEALREMRLLIFELRPSMVENQGLVPALRARLEAVEERAGLKVQFDIEGDVSLPNQTQDSLYRIAQEALNNALKHANAQNISVRLTEESTSVILEVIDDGVGFDPQQSVAGAGLGLDGILERAEAMEGRAYLISSPGLGTNIKVEVPRGR